MKGKGLSPGDRFAGRFLLGRRLGAGGLAEVFEATDEATGDRVALKILHRHLAGDAQLCERFRRELRAARSLAHPNVVRVFDLHEGGARPAFSMELLEGETLAQRLSRGPLPVEEALRIGQALCTALGEAHARGIVHRDVKPQNVFLTAGGAVKLLDFGLSRVAGQARLTAQSVVMGTPGYVAPELLAGLPSDGRADLWSLGATLFELFTGRRAYPARDPFAALAAQKGAPPSPRALRPELPEALDAAVRRALEPDPGRRFLDASQLSRALGGEALPEAPPSRLALQPGGFSVLRASVFEVTVGKWPGPKLGAVLERMGARDPLRLFRLKVVPAGALARGLSRRSADELARVSRALGVFVLVAKDNPERTGWVRRLLGSLRWTERKARFVSLLTGLVSGALVGGGVGLFIHQWLLSGGSAQMLRYHLQDPEFLSRLLRLSLLIGTTFGALVGFLLRQALLVWIALAGAPALGPNVAGDPAVGSLLMRAEEALVELRAQHAAAPAHGKLLLEELLRAMEVALSEGRKVAARVSQLPDPLAPSEQEPDQVATAPAGLARPLDEERDSGMQRLLRLAAAVEDAVAAARPVDPARGLAAPDPAPASAELRLVSEALAEGGKARLREG